MADLSAGRIKDFIKPLEVRPGSKVKLPEDFDPAYTGDLEREAAEGAQAVLQQGVSLLSELQAKLAAQTTDAVLIILQAMDAAGKDGTIRHVMSGVNPQGVEVHSFKAPTAEDLAHDYLWRYMTKLPARGRIGIFNRSYYEEVLVVRVHPNLLDGRPIRHQPTGSDLWKRRFDEINGWERYLTGQGVHVVKLFLNVSKAEQRRRFLSRIDESDKNWKFSGADIRERNFWDDYQAAFSEVLSHTSTEWAPWYVIPADHKWFARLGAAGVIVSALQHINPEYPTVSPQALAALHEAEVELTLEDPSLVREMRERQAAESGPHRSREERGKKGKKHKKHKGAQSAEVSSRA